MGAALLTVFLFACSGLAGERSARYWGGQQANVLRLLMATILMGGVVALWFPNTLHPETFLWLFGSGIAGFGFGDIALFLAYVRIGARLTILLNLCTAPLWSAGVEWLWLGTSLSQKEMGAGAIVLCGVVLALLSRPATFRGNHSAWWTGIAFGLVAGCGQGTGAVISRKAYEVAALAGTEMNGLSAAAQRISGGVVTAAIFFLALHRFWKVHSRPTESVPLLTAWVWLMATTLCGPVLGVTCFQWALHEAPAGLVTSITATTPIAMIPLVMLMDGERPTRSSLAGAAVAVTGVILLLLVG